MGIVKERVAIPNFDSLLPTLKSPKEVKDILIKNKIVSDENIRPIITGVCFDISKENGVAVATDTHKLIGVKFNPNSEDYKPFEGKCVNNEMGSCYKSNLGGCEIEGIYPNYPAVFPKEANYKVSIELKREVLTFLKKHTNSQNKIYIKQGDFEVYLKASFLYNILKALYELGEDKIDIYAIDKVSVVSFVGKTTKSLLMPMLWSDMYQNVKETFFIDESEGIRTLVITDFDTFQKEFREGKYKPTTTKEKQNKSLSEGDIFIYDKRRIVTQNDEFTAVSDGFCAWIEKGEGGMGIEGLIEKCERLSQIPKFFIEKPEKLFELNIKDFVNGFEDYYNEHLKRQEENYYNEFLGNITAELGNDKSVYDKSVYIPKNYEELKRILKKNYFYSNFNRWQKPQKYTFTKNGINEDCFVGITIDDKTMWQKPQNLKKLLGVFTKLGYDIVYVGIVYNMQEPMFYFESTDGKYRLIVLPCRNEHTGENRDYIKKFVGNGVSSSEVQSGISNFDTMLKMFEENGIQTEFVDTDEKIIERLKKEGHSDENINFSMQEQESLELDDEDNEPKQGTLNFGFWEYQSAKKIAKDVHNHWIDEHKGSANAYNDIVKQIENYQEAGYTDEMIVRNILDHAKRWYRWNEKQMFDEIEKIPETTRSAYLNITKKDEGNDKE